MLITNELPREADTNLSDIIANRGSYFSYPIDGNRFIELFSAIYDHEQVCDKATEYLNHNAMFSP